MHRVPVILVASVLAGLSFTFVAAQSPMPRSAPADAGLDPARLAAATELLNQMVADQAIAGAVAAVARHGTVAYLQPVGVQSLETRVPMSERSLFRIYSMTKAVTAVAVMMLHEEGRFGLDDPVSKYLPEFADVTVGEDPAARQRPVRPITVRDLLLHTSGLSHRTSDLYRRLAVRSRADTLPQFVGKITRAPLMEDPGTRFRYSEATTVLGRLVEVWSSTSFDAFLKARVFDPLGMIDTSFWVPPAAAARLATVYKPNPAGGLLPTETEDSPFTAPPVLLEGAVGLVSSVPDFVAFCQMLLNKGEYGGRRLLKADTVALMTANGLPADVLALRGGTQGWGLINANVQTSPDSPVAGEYTWDGTAGTIFWVDPAREMITVLMTQVQPTNPNGIRQKFKAIVQSAVR